MPWRAAASTLRSTADQSGGPSRSGWMRSQLTGTRQLWTPSGFLAEAGFEVTGYDLVPGNVELAAERARRWGLSERARFAVADFEALEPGEPAELVLIFDALHHSTRPAQALAGAARRLAPGGWL